jgi:hypothetical protein
MGSFLVVKYYLHGFRLEKLKNVHEDLRENFAWSNTMWENFGEKLRTVWSNTRGEILLKTPVLSGRIQQTERRVNVIDLSSETVKISK